MIFCVKHSLRMTFQYMKKNPSPLIYKLAKNPFSYDPRVPKICSVNRNKAGYTATSCGRVGRGRDARFPTFRLDHFERTDGQMDGRTKPLIELRVRN